MKKVNVYLDDLRVCPEGYTIARNYADALAMLREGNVGVLSLDHDLGEYPDGTLQPTGYDLVKAMCFEGLNAEIIYIHTDNVVGRANMYETLLSARRHGFISADTVIYHYGSTPNLYED